MLVHAAAATLIIYNLFLWFLYTSSNESMLFLVLFTYEQAYYVKNKSSSSILACISEEFCYF